MLHLPTVAVLAYSSKVLETLVKIQYFCSETTLFEPLAFASHSVDHKQLVASRAIRDCHASFRPAQQV